MSPEAAFSRATQSVPQSIYLVFSVVKKDHVTTLSAVYIFPLIIQELKMGLEPPISVGLRYRWRASDITVGNFLKRAIDATSKICTWPSISTLQGETTKERHADKTVGSKSDLIGVPKRDFT
jgi:hypothetical protein